MCEHQPARLGESLAAATLAIARALVVAAARTFCGFTGEFEFARVDVPLAAAALAIARALVVTAARTFRGFTRDLLIRSNRRRSRQTGCRTPHQRTQ